MGSVKPKKKSPSRKQVEELDDKQRRFVCEYLKDYNQTRAARAAGYKSAATMGAKLLKNPVISQLIGRAQYENIKRSRLTRDRVIEELTNIALLDVADLEDEEGNVVLTNLRQLPQHVRRAVKYVDVQQIRDKKGRVIGQQARVYPLDKLDALKLIMKHFGMLTDKVDVQHTVDVRHTISLEVLDEILREMGIDSVEVMRKLLQRLRENVQQEEVEKKTIEAEYKRIDSVHGGLKHGRRTTH